MIEKFQYYIDENLVRKGPKDLEEAKSLIEKAFKRKDFIKMQKIDESTATFIFEDVYECVREAAQSLMSLEGYKPYSHEAVIAFLREFHKFEEGETESFNRYRILRNNCVYKAARVSPKTCMESIKFMESFLPRLRKEFEAKMKK